MRNRTSIIYADGLRDQRVRGVGEGAFVYDVTDSSNPVLRGQAFDFFGASALKDEPGLSYQWLTEITVASNELEAQGIKDAAAREVQTQSAIGELLSLQMDYSCSAVGANLRILTTNLKEAAETYSYIIVDEQDDGSAGPMLVSEIWIAKCDSPSSNSKLTPRTVRGKTLLSPNKAHEYVSWEAVAYRVLTKS